MWGTSSVHLFSTYGTDIILGALTAPTMVGACRGGARIAITASSLVLQPLTMLTWSRFTGLEKRDAGKAAMRAARTENMAVGAAILRPMNTTVALLVGAPPTARCSRVKARLRTQFGVIVRVGEKTDIEHEIRIQWHPVLEAEAHHVDIEVEGDMLPRGGDLLTAGISEKQARSIKDQMTFRDPAVWWPVFR